MLFKFKKSMSLLRWFSMVKIVLSKKIKQTYDKSAQVSVY